MGKGGFVYQELCLPYYTGIDLGRELICRSLEGTETVLNQISRLWCGVFFSNLKSKEIS